MASGAKGAFFKVGAILFCLGGGLWGLNDIREGSVRKWRNTRMVTYSLSEYPFTFARHVVPKLFMGALGLVVLGVEVRNKTRGGD